MKIVPQLDAGPTLIQAKIDIDSNTNYETLSKKMSHLGASKILDALDLIEKKKANLFHKRITKQLMQEK